MSETWNVKLYDNRIIKVAVFNFNGKDSDDREWNYRGQENPMSWETYGAIRIGEDGWADWFEITKEGAQKAISLLGKEVSEEEMHRIYDECNKAGENIKY